MDADAYGRIVVTQRSPTVVAAPEHSLVSLELLRQMHGAFFTEPDVLLVGHFEDGSPCLYRVAGWDAEQKALVVRRADTQEGSADAAV